MQRRYAVRRIKTKRNGRKESGGKIMMKVNKIRKRIKVKINKQEFVRITGEPDNTIKWDELIGYCRKNMIPLANLPEELVNKFRTE